MALYDEHVVVQGGWVKASELEDGQKAKIVGEIRPVPSQFKDEKTGEMKTQNVGKVHFQGQKEATNMSINRTTLNGLVRAFGRDSKDWTGKYLTVTIKETEVGGKVRDAIYLIPEGFKLDRDENNYRVIVPVVNTVKVENDIPIVDTDQIKESDLPF